MRKTCDAACREGLSALIEDVKDVSARMTETQRPATKCCHHEHHAKVSEQARLTRSKAHHRAALRCEHGDDPVITASRDIVLSLCSHDRFALTRNNAAQPARL